MRFNLVTYQAILFLFIFSGVFSVYADDKPKLFKKGGVPYENLWKERDVKNYLDLPYLTSTDDIVSVSTDDIVSKLEAVQGIGKYQIIKDKNRPFKLNNKELDAISFDLRGEDSSVFHVTVYDYQSWNSACDKLFRYITGTVAMWNKIPDYYAIKKSDDIYTITRKVKNPQKWHFDLKKRFVIGVYSKVRQESTKSEEKTIAQIEIDQVIQRLVAIIEGKDNEGSSIRGEGQETEFR